MPSFVRSVRANAGLAALCLSFAWTVQAAPPAAPAVTAGADLKTLRFDWNYVPQANRYELWFRANDGATWAKFGDTPSYRPRITSGVSAHLLDWNQARYQVRACNPSGCTGSAPIGVQTLMPNTIGYFKASSLHNKARFGLVSAISEDGNTMAAFTAEETAPYHPQFAIYIFRKTNGQWRQEERLFVATDFGHPSGYGYFNTGLDSPYDASLSLSADGNVMTATYPMHSIHAPAFQKAIMFSIYRREEGRWLERVQYLNSEADTGSLGRVSAEVNDAGDRILFRPGFGKPVKLLVAGQQPWSWNEREIFNPRSDLANGYACPQVRLSGSGEVVAWTCARLVRPDEKHLFVDNLADPSSSYSAPLDFPAGHFLGELAVDHDGRTIATGTFYGSSDATDPRNRIQIFRAPESPGGSWSAEEPLFPGAWNASPPSSFGISLDLSRDGKLLAVVDPGDEGAGTGVLSPPLAAGGTATGATYVYELREAGPRLRRVLKPNNAIPLGGLQGGVAAFAQNGKTLLVSEPDEPGNSPGIDGDRNRLGRDRTGAIWLY